MQVRVSRLECPIGMQVRVSELGPIGMQVRVSDDWVRIGFRVSGLGCRLECPDWDAG